VGWGACESKKGVQSVGDGEKNAKKFSAGCSTGNRVDKKNNVKKKNSEIAVAGRRGKGMSSDGARGGATYRGDCCMRRAAAQFRIGREAPREVRKSAPAQAAKRFRA